VKENRLPSSNVATSTREPLLDAVKGFAILTVVLGHTIQSGLGPDYLESEAYFSDGLFKAIYSFHMPLFMLISGYLYYPKIMKLNSARFVEYLFKSIGIPLFVWNLLILLLVGVARMIQGEELLTSESLSILINSNWFLFALLTCALIAKLFYRLRIGFFSSLAISTLISVATLDFANMHLVKFVLPFFLVGFFAAQKFTISEIKDFFLSKRVLLLSACAWGIGFMFMSDETFIYVSGYQMSSFTDFSQALVILHRFVLGLTGTSLVFTFFIWTSDYFKYKTLVVFGNKSMGIYLISGPLTTFVLPRVPNFEFTTTVNVGLNFVWISLVSLSFTFLVQRFRLLNIILLGNRSR
jgi:fucose 4-O-acetylase-like acetyltransferase